jgi:poly(3-hydroxybutyrate) depolymerase
MRGHDSRDSGLLSELVRRAANHDGEWPTLSVWHGSADATVDHSNALALVEQWRPLHDAPENPSETNLVNGYPHRVWRNPQGREVVELYTITGLAHGTPLNTRSTNHGERAAPFMLEAGVSSTHLIARFWDIVPDQADQRPVTVSAELDTASRPQPRAPAETYAQAGQVKLKKTIEDALRTAGLMR